MRSCRHLDEIQEVQPSGDGCVECLATNQRWMHLRLCMECGHVGCCDDSPNRHASAHFRDTQHPVMRSFEPGEEWGWCFVDGAMLDARRWAVDGPSHHSPAANAHRLM